MKRSEVESFLKRHGGVAVCGDSPSGPMYQTADGWSVFVPLDSDEVVVRGPICPTCGWRHTHDEGGYCGFKNSWVGWPSG